MQIIRARGGALRAAGTRYLEEHHYMRSAGGSGALFIVLDQEQIVGGVLIGKTASQLCDESLINGAVLIGPLASADAERSVCQPGVCVRQIKRSHLLDDVDMYESHLLRTTMQEVTDELDQPTLFVSYADPAATDSRTGLPLTGWVYLASGFFYVGETSTRRSCVVDHNGRARSTRQGKITLSRRSLPRAGDTFHGELVTADWTMHALPAARIWVAPVTPSHYSRRQAKRAYLHIWQNLAPARRVAAKKWIDDLSWQRRQRAGILPIGAPRSHQVRADAQMRPAWWEGHDMTRTAAPVWVPFAWNTRLLALEEVEGEQVGNRTYAPLQHMIDK